MTYKCCDHCKLLANKAKEKNQWRIEGWYANSSLITGKEKDNNGYKAKDLRDMKQIIMREEEEGWPIELQLH